MTFQKRIYVILLASLFGMSSPIDRYADAEGLLSSDVVDDDVSRIRCSNEGRAALPSFCARIRIVPPARRWVLRESCRFDRVLRRAPLGLDPPPPHHPPRTPEPGGLEGLPLPLAARKAASLPATGTLVPDRAVTGSSTCLLIVLSSEVLERERLREPRIALRHQRPVPHQGGERAHPHLAGEGPAAPSGPHELPGHRPEKSKLIMIFICRRTDQTHTIPPIPDRSRV